MYIKIDGRHAEVFDGGRQLKREEAIELIGKTLDESDDEEAIKVLSDTLLLLECEHKRLA